MKQKLSLVAALAAALAFPVGAYGWGDGYGGTGSVPAPSKHVPGSSKPGGGTWPGSGKAEQTGTQGSNNQGGQSGGNWPGKPGKQSGQSGGGWPGKPGKQAGSGGKWPGGGPSYGGGGRGGPIYGSAGPGRWEHRSGYGGYRPGRGRWEHRSGYGYPYHRGRDYPRRYDNRSYGR